MVIVSKVESRRDWNAFLRLPWKVYHGDSHWVPPILSFQRRELDRKKGPFFNDGFGSTAEFFLARRDGEVVGRIAAIRNGRHLSRQQDQVGFFGFFEVIDDLEVTKDLLERAEEWLRGQGCAISRGPTSFTLNDPAGVTVKGGDLRPSIQIAYTPPYYRTLLEEAGYHKVRDLFSYHVDVEVFEERLFKYEDAFVSSPPGGDGGLVLRQLSRRELESDAGIITRIFSESWDRNWGAFPMLPEDLIRAARDLSPFFDERLGGVVMSEGEPVGVFLAVPDPWEIFHHLNGRIGLRGLFRILRDRKKISRYRALILGVLPEYRKLPIGPLIVEQIRRHRTEYPAMKTIEFSWILEDNIPMRSIAEALGGVHCQTLRIFEKYLV